MPIKKVIKKSSIAKTPSGKPAKTTTGSQTVARPQTLSAWLFKWPLKFSLLVLVFAIISSLIIGLTATLQIKAVTTATTVIMLAASAYILLRQSIKYAGSDLLDRRGFLIIDIGIALVALCYYTLFYVLGLLISSDTIIFIVYTLMAKSALLYYAALMPFAIIALYIIGLSVFNVIAIYKYARNFGIPKLPLLLSVPFGISFLGYPAYFVDSPKAATLPVKSKWFNNLIDWVMRAPLHGLAGLLFTTLAFVFFMNISVSLLLAASLVAFFIMMRIYGPKNLASKGTKYLIFGAIAVNVLYILILLYSAMGTPAAKHIDISDIVSIEQSENIEVIDVR
ncbi:MAG: hypothetical protein FWG80_03830 [Alphaproteobacteria bacterium]|nr:hypothetical protein [Alphaproteobacteria bacterium]